MNPNDHFGSGNLNENPHDDFPAREAVFRTEDEVLELRRRLDHFALAQQALYELFAAKLGVTDDEVMAKMAGGRCTRWHGGPQAWIHGPRVSCLQAPHTGQHGSLHLLQCAGEGRASLPEIVMRLGLRSRWLAGVFDG